jgi:Xaa-Pro dipeptidase
MALMERIGLLQEKLKEQQLDGALLFYSRDVFYYTGTAQPSYLVVLPDDYTLFIRSGFDFALNEVFIEKERLRQDRRLENIYREISSRLKDKKMGTELDVLPTERFFEFQKIFSGCEFVDISPLVLEQRKRKDHSEIDSIKEACKVIHEGHKAALSNLREGITELELSAAIENAHRLAGHEGIFFLRQPDFFMSRGPIASGPNLSRFSGVVYSITGVGLSPAVPVGPSRRSISKGDLVVFDIPTMVKGYHSDQTRTYILGKAGIEVKEMYNTLKEMADHLIENIRPGVKCSQIFQMAVDKAGELKVTDAFLNFGGGKKSHMIGHGIGLECTEPPIFSKYDHSELSEDFVMALEMHMFRQDVGVIKLEDVILIGKEKNEILTKSSRELSEVQC